MEHTFFRFSIREHVFGRFNRSVIPVPAESG